MDNAALIYSFRRWCPGPVWDDIYLPIMPSIASFRAFDTKTAVYVIDSTDHETDWGDWPRKLNFTVLRRPHAFRPFDGMCQAEYNESGLSIFWNLLSKPLDVYETVLELPHEVFMVSDADVFFIKDPWPLHDDPTQNFVCGTNTGFYYFHKYKPATAQVFETWAALCALALTHPRIRKKVQVKHLKVVQEESIYWYMLRCHAHRLYLKHIYKYENFEARNLPQDKGYDHTLIKMLHVCDSFGRDYRARTAMIIKEVRDVISQVLTREDLSQIYPGYDPPVYPIEPTETFMKLVEQAKEVPQ